MQINAGHIIITDIRPERCIQHYTRKYIQQHQQRSVCSGTLSVSTVIRFLALDG